MVKFERYCLPLLLLWIVQYQLSFGDYIIEHGEPDDELYDDFDCISGYLRTFLIYSEEYTDPFFLDRYMKYIGCAISAGILMKNYIAPPSKVLFCD
uniref:Uncharacterized protein n=1 Tax=Panagrolaimus sp. ES5 TaxID=591445 RepID=A0AC34FZ74_9BILA